MIESSHYFSSRTAICVGRYSVPGDNWRMSVCGIYLEHILNIYFVISIVFRALKNVFLIQINKENYK